MPEAHLAAAPLVVVGAQEMEVSSARYVVGDEVPASVKPLAARLDKKGRMVVGSQQQPRGGPAVSSRRDVAGTESVAEFAGRAVVVYVHKIVR